MYNFNKSELFKKLKANMLKDDTRTVITVEQIFSEFLTELGKQCPLDKTFLFMDKDQEVICVNKLRKFLNVS